jgi:paraquat-inducible protein B
MKGVRKMPVGSSALPSSAYIAESQHAFYKLGINPKNNDIIVTDAGDYTGRGIMLRFSSSGEPKSESLSGIIPGAVSFREMPGHVTD